MPEVFLIFTWESIVDFIALIIIYFLLFYKRWKKKERINFVVKTLFYIYLSVLLFLTLMPILTSLPHLSLSSGGMYMLPFDDLLKSRGPAELQIFLNVLLFVPFGFFLSLIKKPNIFKITMITLLTSLSIELIQPLLNSYRISDVTDVITNTLGGITGFLLFLLLRPFLKKLILWERDDLED